MLRIAVAVCVTLTVACARDPDPCGTLCEGGGYTSLEEVVTEAGLECVCQGALGAEITAEGCADFCSEAGAGSPQVVTTDIPSDTCRCGELP